jgi:hypothetical protein
MEESEIKAIIERLQINQDKNKAYIGFYQYGGGIDESCIKANKEGLELIAAEFLKASIDTESPDLENDSHTYSLDLEGWEDENAHFFFDYVERLKTKPNDVTTNSVYKETWKDQFAKIGCIGLILLIILLIILGAISMFNWF